MFTVIFSLMISAPLLTPALGEDFHPARIYGDKIFKEGGKLQIKCSTFGFVEPCAEVFIYLCRNGTAIEKKKSREQDVVFSIDGITKDYTGNYSCVFSKKECSVKEVRGQSSESIFIMVKDSFVPAETTLPEISVNKGTDVNFKCTSSRLPDTVQHNIYAYLCKNGTVIQVNIWNAEKMETIFTLKEVTMRDAGSYTCGLMAGIQPIPKTRVHGLNEANLHVTEKQNLNDTTRIVMSCSIMLLLLLCCLGLWGFIVKRGHCRCHNQRSTEHEAEASGGETLNQGISNADAWDDFSQSSENDCARDEDLYQVCEEMPSSSDMYASVDYKAT